MSVSNPKDLGLQGVAEKMEDRTMDDLKGWKKERCSRCGGHGTIWLGIDGGPGECPDCNGGMVFVTPKGRRVLYPGGPFCAG